MEQCADLQNFFRPILIDWRKICGTDQRHLLGKLQQLLLPFASDPVLPDLPFDPAVA